MHRKLAFAVLIVLASLAVLGWIVGPSDVAHGEDQGAARAPSREDSPPVDASAPTSAVSPPSANESSDQPRIHTAGETAFVGRTAYLVHGARWSPPPSHHLLIDISVANNDKRSIQLPPFMLIDQDGVSYRRSIVDLPGAIPKGLEMNPGITERGLLVFRVPLDREYTLQAWDGAYRELNPALFKLEPARAR